MSEKRLSEIMAASSRAIEDAQEVLDEAITNAVNTYFDAGVAVERERIIKLLEEHADGDLLFAESLSNPSEEVAYTIFKGDIIALIKGEHVR